jgi:hypothetical protein
MAWAYLDDDATSFAAANWSDATGFADGATLGIVSGRQTIDTALDQSGLSSGINNFRVGWDFEGNIGTPTAPLEVDCDNATNPMISYAGAAGAFYIQASGNNNVITSFQHAGLGRSFLQGGTFTSVGVGRGELIANSSTAVTNLRVGGGLVDIDEHASSTFTLCAVAGGLCTVKRGGTTFEVGANGRLRQIDPDATATTVNVWGGVLDWRGGDITTLNWFGGTATLARAHQAPDHYEPLRVRTGHNWRSPKLR